MLWFYIIISIPNRTSSAAAEGCDVIIATVAPNVKNTRTVEERHQHYADVLVASCHSARQACDRVIFLSSFSVYGDGSGAPGPSPPRA